MSEKECFAHFTPDAVICKACVEADKCKVELAANFKRCHEMHEVEKCSECEVYEDCCEYGDDKRDEYGLNIVSTNGNKETEGSK
jgi:propanediol dehydratase small subunit